MISKNSHKDYNRSIYKMNEEKLCQNLFITLLLANTKSRMQNPSTYIRELNETSLCDHFYDFSKIRKVYRDYIGSERMQRILLFNETMKDEKQTIQAITYYYERTDRHILSALNNKTKLWYYTIHQIEKILNFDEEPYGVWKYMHPKKFN
jgi:hypothetical protein